MSLSSGDHWLSWHGMTLVSPTGTAKTPFFLAHAYEVGHSSHLVYTTAAYPCKNLWFYSYTAIYLPYVEQPIIVIPLSGP